jgi:hypothetical protein
MFNVPLATAALRCNAGILASQFKANEAKAQRKTPRGLAAASLRSNQMLEFTSTLTS